MGFKNFKGNYLSLLLLRYIIIFLVIYCKLNTDQMYYIWLHKLETRIYEILEIFI